MFILSLTMLKDLLSSILSDKKQSTIFFGIIVLFVVTLANVYVAKTRIPTSALKTPTATLSLNPTQKSVTKDQTFDVAIILDTKDEKVDAVDAILTYDPSILEVTGLSPGTIFSAYPVKSYGEGKIQLSGFALPEGETPKPFSGKGTLGTITFKALNSGSTKVIFGVSSIIAYQGQNALGKIVEATYTVK